MLQFLHTVLLLNIVSARIDAGLAEVNPPGT